MDIADILKTSSRTIRSKLEVKVNAANSEDYYNSTCNDKIILHAYGLNKAYKSMRVDINTIIKESQELYTFDEGMGMDEFSSIISVLDEDCNIKFLACAIDGKVINGLSLDGAIEILYKEYTRDIVAFNRCIERLSGLSTEENQKKYRPTICSLFITRISLVGELKKQADRLVAQFLEDDRD